MAQADRGVEIATGRRRRDGHVRLVVFTRDLLALSIEDYGERAPTLLLTRAQVVELQRALAQLLPSLHEPTAESGAAETWTGGERRQLNDERGTMNDE